MIGGFDRLKGVSVSVSCIVADITFLEKDVELIEVVCAPSPTTHDTDSHRSAFTSILLCMYFELFIRRTLDQKEFVYSFKL